MDLIRLVDRLAAEKNGRVAFAGERCLHVADRFQECENCRAVCPADAFTGEKIPDFVPEKCVQCLACLPVCPAGALVAKDEVPDLLRFVRHLSSQRIELVCRHNPDVGRGTPGVEAAISVRGCLAGLGLGALLLLAAEGVSAVVLRNDACADCQWSGLGKQVAKQVAQAQLFLGIWHQEDVVSLSGPAGETWWERPVYSAGSPPVSRRDLFRLRKPTPVNEGDNDIADGNQPFRERLRLVRACQKLGPPAANKTGDRLPGLGFATVSFVSPTCNACGACARACPTGALKLDIDDHAYALTFDSRACVGCAVCAHVCPLSIVDLNHEPPFESIFGEPDPVVLQSGPVARCRRCRARFPAGGGEDYCAVCRFRLRHPFGAARPEDMVTRKETHPGWGS
jgi:ferredoxin